MMGQSHLSGIACGLVDDGAKVGVLIGLRAAEKLQAVLERRGRGDDIAEMRLQVNQIIEAVKSKRAQSMWGAIVAKLDRPQQHPEVLD